MGTQIKAEIVAHSINEQGDELISVLATFPRIILAEVNTHRMLSKNTSSSRAIPFKKMVETIGADPFIPIAWQKDHKGMQGTEYLVDVKDIADAQSVWLSARDEAVAQAKMLSENERVTKQLANRLLEPFMWTTMLITGPKSGWENFFHLRCPQYTLNNDDIFRSKKDFKAFYKDTEQELIKGFGIQAETIFAKDEDILAWLKCNKGQAEIHMMALAEKIYDAYNESTPKVLKAGDWHIPFEDKMSADVSLWSKDIKKQAEMLGRDITDKFVKVSVAMAARTSYTVVGEEKEIDYEAMIGLHDRLLAQDPPHSSPLEHCARAMNNFECTSYIKGKLHNPEFQDSEGEVIDYLVGIEASSMGWCNNFKGFIPYRYMVDNGNQL